MPGRGSKAHYHLAADLEKINFKNLVWFYREELEKVRRGVGKTASVFSGRKESQHLTMWGVLAYRPGTKRMRHVLTEAALKELDLLRLETPGVEREARSSLDRGIPLGQLSIK